MLKTKRRPESSGFHAVFGDQLVPSAYSPLSRPANAEFNATQVELFASGITSMLSQQYSTQTQHCVTNFCCGSRFCHCLAVRGPEGMLYVLLAKPAKCMMLLSCGTQAAVCLSILPMYNQLQHLALQAWQTVRQ